MACSSASLAASASRRRLLASSNEQAWEGYRLSFTEYYTASGVDDRQAPERARYAGVRQNRVVGGLFLHTTRKVIAPGCQGEVMGARQSAGWKKRVFSADLRVLWKHGATTVDAPLLQACTC